MFLRSLENVCSKSMEWSVPMWCASLDWREAFDRIEYNAVFDALKVQGVPYAYLKLIPSLYHGRFKPIAIQCWLGTCDEKIEASYSTLRTSLWSQ